MVLSKKSWHYWFYKQFFNRTPSNFCPYFWKVIISVAVSPIALVLALPWIVFKVITGDWLDKDTLGKMTANGFASWLLMGLISCMLVVIFYHKNPGITAFGIVGWIIGAVIALTALVESGKDKISISNTFIGKFIAAKKGKYCPRIEWDENNSSNS